MTELVMVGRYNTRNAVYHTTDCTRCPEHPNMWRRETAEKQGLRECKFCSGDHERPDNSNTDVFEAAVKWEPDQ